MSGIKSYSQSFIERKREGYAIGINCNLIDSKT